MSTHRKLRNGALVVALAAVIAGTFGFVLMRSRTDGTAEARGVAEPSTAGPMPAATPGSPATSPGTSPAARPGPHDRPQLDPRALLVWVPGHLPDGLAAAVTRLPDVAHVAAVVSGTSWMTVSTAPSGATLDRPAPPFAIPIEVSGADPTAYEPFVMDPATRAGLARLRQPGRTLLGASEAALRRQAVGGTLTFGGRVVTVAGVVPDAAIGAHEAFVSRGTAAALGLTTPKYLLVLPELGAAPHTVAAQLRALVPAADPVLVEPATRVPFARDTPNTIPAVLEKLAMGEFAAVRSSHGVLRLEPRWVRAHIVTERVPILGPVTCNGAFVPQLRAALAEVVRRGLASMIHRDEYAGCFVPRFVTRDPTQLISNHSYGSAFDVNVPENRFGAAPHQDPRIVAIFEHHGFRWGGRWLVPDGMHFEFRAFPRSP